MPTSALAFWLALIALLVPILPGSPPVKKDKLKPDDLVARHLESTGLISGAFASLLIEGTGSSRYMTAGRGRGGTSDSGDAFLAFQGQQIYLQIPCPEQRYRSEIVLYDGNDVYGTNTLLARFVRQFQILMDEGLISGVYSMNWALANLEEQKPKLKYKGLKKKGGRKLHELEYLSKRGSDGKILLYFDAARFCHVMTEFNVLRHLPTVRGQIGQSERYSLEEQYSDFRDVDGLILPHCWQIKVVAPGSSILVEVTAEHISKNVPIDPKVFSVK